MTVDDTASLAEPAHDTNDRNVPTSAQQPAKTFNYARERAIGIALQTRPTAVPEEIISAARKFEKFLASDPVDGPSFADGIRAALIVLKASTRGLDRSEEPYRILKRNIDAITETYL